VGRYVDESGQAHVLVETLNAGTWTPSVPTLPLGADGDLRSVSCPSTTACVAVGVYYDGTNGAVHPLVETLAGGTWTPTTPAVPAGTGYAELQGVSCPTATSGCLAVGAFGDGTGVHPLVDTRAGTAWSASAPMDALPGSFYGVSCPTATTACVAVGQYRGDTPGGHALIVTLDGGAWSRSRPGVPPGLMPGFRGTEVRGVSCPVATTGCWAVGAVDDDNGDLFGLTASNTP